MLSSPGAEGHAPPRLSRGLSLHDTAPPPPPPPVPLYCSNETSSRPREVEESRTRPGIRLGRQRINGPCGALTLYRVIVLPRSVSKTRSPADSSHSGPPPPRKVHNVNSSPNAAILKVARELRTGEGTGGEKREVKSAPGQKTHRKKKLIVTHLAISAENIRVLHGWEK